MDIDLTCQFASIVAISTENTTAPTAWRQKGLRDAANFTGLDIGIHNAEQDEILLSWYVGLPITDSGRRLGVGYALSGKAHIDTLQR